MSDSQHNFSPCDDGKWTLDGILHYNRKTFSIHYITPQEKYAEKQRLLQDTITDCSPEGDWAMVALCLYFRLIEQKKEGE